ncbi:uncharacterized protein LOC113675986 [Pocillopora damicornis]|uniref:uncharacterized protein LOC113675986 n=1 Tax=Pocillopora damicornis TaxID=46731 RepID=UPI000F55472A|nr:uncharacterized protein LOC113675986 [Pocillopora damicornis]
MKRNSFRAVFERTWTKVCQMVMTTDLPCTGNMDQNQTKTDAPFVGNKLATGSASSRSERQVTRVLRSKSSMALKNGSSSSDTQKEQLQPSTDVPLVKPSEPEIACDGSNHKMDVVGELTQLRQLLLLHLELIQQQQEQLQMKDREINKLKEDKEQKYFLIPGQGNYNISGTPSGDKSIFLFSVPTWQVNEIAAVRTGNSKSLKLAGSSSSSSENNESIDDDVFAKRHMKHEVEERRRKRWDIQHMRAMQAHQNLEKKSRDREEARLKGKRSGCKDEDCKNIESFLPPPEDVMAVEVSDTVPVVAFGFPVPLFQEREFEIPWFSLDKRELLERKGKVRPGRSRGKLRGRRKGY